MAYEMTAHVQQTDIERAALGDLGTTARIHRHLFGCECCLRRLIDVQARLAAREFHFSGVIPSAQSNVNAYQN